MCFLPQPKKKKRRVDFFPSHLLIIKKWLNIGLSKNSTPVMRQSMENAQNEQFPKICEQMKTTF